SGRRVSEGDNALTGTQHLSAVHVQTTQPVRELVIGAHRLRLLDLRNVGQRRTVQRDSLRLVRNRQVLSAVNVEVEEPAQNRIPQRLRLARRVHVGQLGVSAQ